MPEYIIPHNSIETFETIREKGEKKGKGDVQEWSGYLSQMERYPWMKIPGPVQGGACLYVSCDFAGNESMTQLLLNLSELQSLQADKHKGITIVSGRHGSERGNDIMYDGGVFMPSFRLAYPEYESDLKVVSSVKQKCPNANITVVDAGDYQHFPYGNTAHALKAYAKAKLSSGEDVIFQWCYSVSAMRDFIRPADPKDQDAKGAGRADRQRLRLGRAEPSS
jgi:hypothetical protein